MIIKIGNYIESKFMYRGQVFSKKGECICLCSGMAGGGNVIPTVCGVFDRKTRKCKKML